MARVGAGGPLAMLLSALAEELEALAQDLARSGGMISEEALKRNCTFLLRDIQRLDAFSQRSAAVAALLRGISRPATMARKGAPDLAALIEAVPLSGVRRRLAAALADAPEQAPAEEDGSGEVRWL